MLEMLGVDVEISLALISYAMWIAFLINCFAPFLIFIASSLSLCPAR
jgi:hypothetical protein